VVVAVFGLAAVTTNAILGWRMLEGRMSNRNAVVAASIGNALILGAALTAAALMRAEAIR
jgi:hypothetical protein